MAETQPDFIHYFTTAGDSASQEGQGHTARRASGTGCSRPSCFPIGGRDGHHFTRLGKYLLAYILVLAVQTTMLGVFRANVRAVSAMETLAYFAVSVCLVGFSALTLYRCWQASDLAEIGKCSNSLRIQLFWSVVMAIWWAVHLVRDMASSSVPAVDMVALALWLSQVLACAVLAAVAWHGRPLSINTCKFSALPEDARRNDLQCIICLADFELSHKVFHLPCRHIYHAECLCQWLSRADTCPMRCGGTLLQLPAQERSWQPRRRRPESGSATPTPSTTDDTVSATLFDEEAPREVEAEVEDPADSARGRLFGEEEAEVEDPAHPARSRLFDEEVEAGDPAGPVCGRPRGDGEEAPAADDDPARGGLQHISI